MRSCLKQHSKTSLNLFSPPTYFHFVVYDICSSLISYTCMPTFEEIQFTIVNKEYILQSNMCCKLILYYICFLLNEVDNINICLCELMFSSVNVYCVLYTFAMTRTPFLTRCYTSQTLKHSYSDIIPALQIKRVYQCMVHMCDVCVYARVLVYLRVNIRVHVGICVCVRVFVVLYCYLQLQFFPKNVSRQTQ